MAAEFEVLDDPARACAAMLLGPLLGGGHLVLTGGSTPGAVYEELARALGTAEQAVNDATIWFSDERCVSPDDELSNYGLVKRTLLHRLGEGNGPQTIRMEGELGPDEAAERYEERLDEASPLPFEIVLLGLGPDGHIASMFPGQQSLSERSRLVVGVPEAGHEPFVPRVTLTLPALSDARQVVLLVTGESKADAVGRSFGPDAKPDPQTPAAMLVAQAENVTVLLDTAAATKL